MNVLRYQAVIKSPGHLRSDHLVIDLKKRTVVAECSQERDADAVAAALNKCCVRGETRLLEPPYEEVKP